MSLRVVTRSAGPRTLLAGILALSMFGAAPAIAADPGAVPAAAPAPGALDQARSQVSGGNVASAIKSLAPYVEANPRDITAGRYLGDLYVISGDKPGAERAYLAVLTVASRDLETHDRLGNLYASEDRLDEAIAQFEKSLPDVAAFGDLVRAHKRRGDLARFVESYRQAAENNPNDSIAQYGYGVILHRLHQPGRAIQYLTAAVSADPHSCAALDELGATELDLDEAGAGIATIHQCLRINPNDYGALVDLGTASPPETASEAQQYLDRAIALHPERPEAFVDTGFIQDAMGQHDAAIESYHHAIALDPYCRDAYVNLGFDQLGSGALPLAEVTFLHGLSTSSGDGHIEYLLAETFQRQGKTALARREFTDALQSDEPDVVAAAQKQLSSTH